jgi:hypothetical protein
MRIRKVDPAARNLNEHLTVTGLRILYIANLKNLRPAELVDLDGFHGAEP